MEAIRWRRAVLNTSLPATVKLVAMTLQAFTDVDGRARPSTQTLATAASLTDRSVRSALTTLLDAGWIAGERSRGHFPTAYAFTIPGTTFQEYPEGKDVDPERSDLDPERVSGTVLLTTKNTSTGFQDMKAACGDALASEVRNRQVALGWLSSCDLELDVLPVLRARSQGKPPRSIHTWKYFSIAISEAYTRRTGKALKLPPAGNGALGEVAQRHMALLRIAR